MYKENENAAEGTVASCLGQLLGEQFGIIQKCWKGARSNDDPELVHDLRVAIRRFRSLLRLFKGELAPTSATDVDLLLRDAARRLGPVRDFDVWQGFLQSSHIPRKWAKNITWRRYIRKQEIIGKKIRGTVTSALKVKQMKALAGAIQNFLDKEISALETETGSPAAFRQFAGRRLSRLPQRLKKREHLAKDKSMESKHRLRRYVRRERYTTEFYAPFFGRQVRALAARFKTVTGALGNLHDMDVFLEKIRYGRDNPPQGLADLLVKLRRKYHAEFLKSWKRLLQEAEFRF
jgi:CHAD domain-containing protein